MLLSRCNLRERHFWPRDDVVTRFGNYENWLQSLPLFLGARCTLMRKYMHESDL